jgi:SAM-dependent methyltransferase
MFKTKMIKGGGFKSQLGGIKSKFVRLLLSAIYPPPPFVNIINKDDRNIILESIFQKGKTILDIGSGISKGPGGWLWKNIPEGSTIRTMDIVDGPGIDIVADVLNLPEDFSKYDAVVLQSVPEHISDIFLLFKEVDRILRPGGFVYIEMPFLQGVHGDPNDFWRCTTAAFSVLLPNYSVIRIGQSGGPIGSIIWIFCDLLSNLTKFGNLNMAIRFLIRWILAPFRYFDHLVKYTPATERLASENFILVQKRL